MNIYIVAGMTFISRRGNSITNINVRARNVGRSNTQLTRRYKRDQALLGKIKCLDTLTAYLSKFYLQKSDKVIEKCIKILYFVQHCWQAALALRGNPSWY